MTRLFYIINQKKKEGFYVYTRSRNSGSDDTRTNKPSWYRYQLNTMTLSIQQWNRLDNLLLVYFLTLK